MKKLLKIIGIVALIVVLLIVALLARQCISERCFGTAYALVYGCNLTALSELKETLLQNEAIPPLAEYRVGSVISMNTGPNMIGIIYRT